MTRSTTSAERVAGTLRGAILHGELSPGARLGEVELAERLGVSRTPVREALSRLAAEGLVEVSPNRGARVTTWTVAELQGVFDLRLSLEPQLTGFAASNAGPADIADLGALAHRMVVVGSPGPGQDFDALVPLNRTFHDRLVALADHPTLAAALAAAIHPAIVRRNFATYDAASLRRSLAHHVEIVAALRAGDAAWASAVMTAHICNARAVMVRAAGALATTPETDPPTTTSPAEHDRPEHPRPVHDRAASQR